MAPINRKNPVRSRSSASKYSLMEFMKDFPDDDACLVWLWRNRYAPDGEHTLCPSCNEVRTFHRYATSQQRRSWTCTHCGQHVHPTAGTIFHKSSTSLHLWFYAMYLITSTRCGISAKQMERELGVTYKTAWRMRHLIRNELMRQDDAVMSGAVEADETYIGGKRRLGRQRKSGRPKPEETHFVPVLGAVQRKSHVFVTKVRDLKQTTIFPHIEKRVLPASTIYTDEYGTYRRLAKRDYQHGASSTRRTST